MTVATQWDLARKKEQHNREQERRSERAQQRKMFKVFQVDSAAQHASEYVTDERALLTRRPIESTKEKARQTEKKERKSSSMWSVNHAQISCRESGEPSTVEQMS